MRASHDLDGIEIVFVSVAAASFAHESDPKLRADLEGQAEAYYELARKRAQEMGLPSPKTKGQPG